VLATNANSVHPYHLLWADKVFITKGAVAKLEEVLG
jgi:ribosomal protein L4